MRKWLIPKHKNVLKNFRVENTRANGSNINVVFANYGLCQEKIN